jgi:hypothetical protein
MEQIYPTSTGFKIFYGIGTVALVIFTFILPLLGKEGGYSNHPKNLLFPLAGIAGATLVILNLVIRRVILSDFSIKYISIWGSKEIENTNVKGFRVLEKSIAVYPLDSHSSKIKIRDYDSIGNDNELQKGLAKKYTDLDAVGYQNNLDEVYNNNELGSNKEERVNTFENSKLVAQIYNGGGIAIFVLNLIFNDFVFNSNLAKLIPVIYALAGIIILITGKGLIKLIARRSSAYYSIIYGMYPSVISALVVMITYYDFVSGSALFIPVIITTIIIGVLSLRFGYDKSDNAVKGQIPAFIGLSILYAIPLVMLINCKLDSSSPKIYNSSVVKRYVIHNNGRSYCHVVVAASEFSADPSKDLHISQRLYYKVDSLQNVHIAVKRGLLHIPWFYINE